MKLPAPALLLLVMIASSAPKAHGQAKPAGNILYQGFRLPEFGGELYYAVSGSELATFGYNGTGQTITSSALSGDLGYLSNSEAHPFSMIYSGGYVRNTGGQPSSPFQNLALSQLFNTRNLHLTVSDALSYLPNSPTIGLSGIAGVGDLGVPPVGGTGSNPGILSNYSPRLTNSTAVTGQRYLTGSTSVEGTGSFSLLRFVGGTTSDGVQSNQVTGVGGVTHRVDARSSVSTNYTFTKFTYLSPQVSFISQGINLEYLRQLTRKLNVDLSAGPQRTTTSTVSSGSTDLAASLRMAYTGQKDNVSLGYSRSTNAGSGVITGGRSDNIELNGRYLSSRVLSESIALRYTHTASLANLSSFAFTSDVVLASFQLNRQISRNLSAYGSYTLNRQAIRQTATALTAFNGISQVLGVGLTYSPGPIHLGHQ